MDGGRLICLSQSIETGPEKRVGIMMKSLAEARRGFSLVEILTALAVLSVGIWSVADLMSASQRAAGAADYRLQASALARLKLEELKASPALGDAVAAAPGKETLIPASGAAPFSQNARYVWKAALQRDARDANRVDIQVEVLRAGPPRPNEPAVTASGFVLKTAAREARL